MKIRERKTLEIDIDRLGCDIGAIVRDVIQNDIAKQYPNSVVVSFDSDGLSKKDYDDNNRRITRGVLFVTIDTYKDPHDDTINWWGLQTHEESEGDLL